MGILARAVITGFGFAMGAALFKRVSKQLGLDDDAAPTKDKDGDDVPAHAPIAEATD